MMTKTTQSHEGLMCSRQKGQLVRCSGVDMNRIDGTDFPLYDIDNASKSSLCYIFGEPQNYWKGGYPLPPLNRRSVPEKLTEKS